MKSRVLTAVGLSAAITLLYVGTTRAAPALSVPSVDISVGNGTGLEVNTGGLNLSSGGLNLAVNQGSPVGMDLAARQGVSLSVGRSVGLGVGRGGALLNAGRASLSVSSSFPRFGTPSSLPHGAMARVR
jgi:hypothetical protein